MKKSILLLMSTAGIFLMLAMSGEGLNSGKILAGEKNDTLLIKHSIDQFRIKHEGLFFTHTYLNLSATDVVGAINDSNKIYTFAAIYSDTIGAREEPSSC